MDAMSTRYLIRAGNTLSAEDSTLPLPIEPSDPLDCLLLVRMGDEGSYLPSQIHKKRSMAATYSFRNG
jgi:hypothetical protein